MSWVEEFSKLYSEEEEYLEHEGVAHDENPPGRGSGRYGYGTGGRPYQREYDLYARYRKLKADGYSNAEIAKALGYYRTDQYGRYILDENGEKMGDTSMLRSRVQITKNIVYNDLASRATELRSTIDPETGKYYTYEKIGQMLGGYGESTVRSFVNNREAAENRNKTINAVNQLKELVGDGNYINVTKGSEDLIGDGISRDRLKVALQMLKEEGYQVQKIYVPQMGSTNGQKTTLLILCPKDAQPGDASRHRYEIKNVQDPEGDDTFTSLGIQDPSRVDISRVQVRYDEQGGTLKDGLIEIRAIRGEDGELYPACEDLSLGNAKYAQVRIAVDASSKLENGDRYIKGMAVYNEDLPKGVDILVNSNKSASEGLDEALKKMKRLTGKDGEDLGVDTDNPFGATVYQTKLKNGKLSAINVVSDVYGVDQHKEGAWDEWSKNLPAQFLGKQSDVLVKQQLNLKVQEAEDEYQKIISMTNPVVKKQLLNDFAEDCDAAAVDLKAAPLPNQRVQVILPLTTIKPNEIYAPNYETGTTVALVRFPHTGPFETPIVRVNNSNKEARKFMKDAKDAIGINSATAQVLSGADFDGDTVTVIPMTRKNSQGEFDKVVNIKGLGNGQNKLPGLEGFNPSAAFPYEEGMKVMSKGQKGNEMGRISNLITDMSIKGCDDPEELSRAVKYSMVVIDAEKHKLNYKKAEKVYNIKELRDKYQTSADGTKGVSTLLSRAKSPEVVEQRQIWQPSKKTIDPVTGEKIISLSPHRFVNDDKKVVDKKTGEVTYIPTGKVKSRKQKVPKMSLHSDARDLLSDNPSNTELLYADYANRMKAMANQARKEWLATPSQKKDPEAAKLYSNEVNSLNNKLLKAKKNKPREQLAQLVANQVMATRLADNPNMTNEEKKRYRGQALTGARQKTGAHKDRIIFTEKEWEAINHNAISESKLNELLKNADKSSYTELAMPRTNYISDSTAKRIKSLLNAGWTREDIVNAGYASMPTIKKVQSGNY